MTVRAKRLEVLQRVRSPSIDQFNSVVDVGGRSTAPSASETISRENGFSDPLPFRGHSRVGLKPPGSLPRTKDARSDRELGLGGVWLERENGLMTPTHR
jgi:hypothetical protein